jgi:hypothetical protein
VGQVANLPGEWQVANLVANLPREWQVGNLPHKS